MCYHCRGNQTISIQDDNEVEKKKDMKRKGHLDLLEMLFLTIQIAYEFEVEYKETLILETEQTLFMEDTISCN